MGTDSVQEIFNDGVLKADLFPEDKMVWIEWLTNQAGYLQKTCVRDFFKVEKLIKENGWKGWAMGSELENTKMHAILEKVGGVPVDRDNEYVYFLKEFPCVNQQKPLAVPSEPSLPAG